VVAALGCFGFPFLGNFDQLVKIYVAVFLIFSVLVGFLCIYSTCTIFIIFVFQSILFVTTGLLFAFAGWSDFDSMMRFVVTG
jgi:hypothetical protein